VEIPAELLSKLRSARNHKKIVDFVGCARSALYKYMKTGAAPVHIIEKLKTYFAELELLPDWIQEIADEEMRGIVTEEYHKNPDRAYYLSMCDTAEQMRGFLADSEGNNGD
jgi:hypothetical protein